MPQFEGHTLLTETLRVINQALARHANEHPYGEMVARAAELGGLRLGVAVYEGDAPVPVDYYAIEIRDGKLRVVSHGQLEIPVHWRVSVDHLRRVTAHAGEYVEHPAKLDLDWLEGPLGIR
jgi:hypothetical protein